MKRKFFSMSAIASFTAQIVLFFGAVTALTLLYLSYRYADFLTSFIAIGMILTVPWLVISLLPTILVLKDKELRRELLWNQVIAMLIVFVILYGVSVAIGFDAVILAHAKTFLVAVLAFLSDTLARLASLIRQAVGFFVMFYQETVAPLFFG